MVDRRKLKRKSKKYRETIIAELVFRRMEFAIRKEHISDSIHKFILSLSFDIILKFELIIK